jgi:hypothetical protein
MSRENTHFLIMMAIMICLLCMAIDANAQDDDTDEHTALWLARSCIGEAGWSSHQTGECAAIMHVYKKRSAIRGTSILATAARYSAAIKPGNHQRNKWVRHLDGLERPKHWPKGADWNKYKNSWMTTRDHAREFVAGNIPDPLPSAMHYGSRIDRHRAQPNWKLLKTPYRNLFWSVPTRSK